MTCFIEEDKKWLPFIFVITYTSYQVLNFLLKTHNWTIRYEIENYKDGSTTKKWERFDDISYTANAIFTKINFQYPSPKGS